MDQLRGQARRGAERRQAILDAAIAVFAERGFRAGALADVAEKVDLSPAGVLYHFGSKEALLLAVIEERDRRAGEAVAAWPELSALAALRESVRFAEQSEAERGLTALHTVLQAESFEPDAVTHEYFLARSRFLRGLVAGILRDGQARGEVRADVDPAAKAAEVVAFLEGAAVLWLMDPHTTSLVDLYRNYFDDLTRALAPSGGPR